METIPNYNHGILCRHGKQFWNGSPPQCAFNTDGTFRSDNWNCFLLNKIGQLWKSEHKNSWGTSLWDDDQNYGVFTFQIWLVIVTCVGHWC
jgi:hypothetical protein